MTNPEPYQQPGAGPKRLTRSRDDRMAGGRLTPFTTPERVTGIEPTAYRTAPMPARMRSMPARNCSRSSCPGSCVAT